QNSRKKKKHTVLISELNLNRNQRVDFLVTSKRTVVDLSYASALMLKIQLPTFCVWNEPVPRAHTEQYNFEDLRVTSLSVSQEGKRNFETREESKNIQI